MYDRNDLGATGRYPSGSCRPDDLGEIRLAVTASREAGRIVIDFGKPVTWVALTAEDAEGFIEVLRAKVRALRGTS
jgi:hypothetical protein